MPLRSSVMRIILERAVLGGKVYQEGLVYVCNLIADPGGALLPFEGSA